jgi:serine/threonine-protein phosphatase 2B catalytic subunit
MEGCAQTNRYLSDHFETRTQSYLCLRPCDYRWRHSRPTLDFVKLLKVGGDPESTKYVFLGDYVDRGNFGFEVMLLVMGLKINFPNSVFLLRGNHESRQMTISFNFRQEILAKHEQQIFDKLIDVFDPMPV